MQANQHQHTHPTGISKTPYGKVAINKFNIDLPKSAIHPASYWGYLRQQNSEPPTSDQPHLSEEIYSSSISMLRSTRRDHQQDLPMRISKATPSTSRPCYISSMN
ncbi:hypothetical protein Nepgr_033739 [Nepenthes gracilis]|uniref:Uncharacterized protein n=1 Tax=Nepenthes gracilis TaxID=150966 RepID=A0AAD3TKZ5_NEPGR|nr:hypothetical protein Nepgr_033739 [Nepenthes gracilis]